MRSIISRGILAATAALLAACNSTDSVAPVAITPASATLAVSDGADVPNRAFGYEKAADGTWGATTDRNRGTCVRPMRLGGNGQPARRQGLVVPALGSNLNPVPA